MDIQNQNPIDKASDIKRKILAFLEKNGPSLPIPISKETGISSLFSSAFLSELLDEDKIRISRLKVGGSPLYFLPNHEHLLENFTRFLPQKEKEALAMLKEKQVLKDIGLEPSIRVALRSLKDFAFPEIIEKGSEKILFWRYFTLKPDETRQKIESIKSEIKPELAKSKEQAPLQVKAPADLPKLKIQPSAPAKPASPAGQTASLIQKPEETAKKEKVLKENEFSRKIEQNIIESGLEVIEKLEIKKKDFTAKIFINSQIGKTPYLCIAKDKKKITDNDFALALQKAQAIKLPLLFISQGDLSEKAKAYLKAWEGMIKFSKIT